MTGGMPMSMERLTELDVERLLTDPSGDARAETAAKLAAVFDPAQLSAAEREIAERIFQIMVKDAEVRVREALAKNLKENPDIPRDIALSLAQDVDQVALPVLEYSEVLTDDDLIEIVKGAGPEKQVAIAGRPNVSEGVSEALVETHNEAVVVRLVTNNGARISEESFQTVVDDFGENETMQSAMVERAHYGCRAPRDDGVSKSPRTAGVQARVACRSRNRSRPQ